MSSPLADEPMPLSADLVAYYRSMLELHTDDPSTLACPICHKHRCEDYRHAWEQLVCAGELKI